MRVAEILNHQHAMSEWTQRGLDEWLGDLFESADIDVTNSGAVRNRVRARVEAAGWAVNVKIDQEIGLSVLAMKDDLALHLQTGNISRAAYDLLKLQYLYSVQRIEAAALAVPTKAAASAIGSNIANFDRIAKELAVFDRVITVPIVLVAFE